MDAAVIDASVAVKWVIDETDSEFARELADTLMHAPAILPVECAHALAQKVARGELNADGAVRRLRLIEQAPVDFVYDEMLALPALQLALELNLTVDACMYLALAVRMDVPLVTADPSIAQIIRANPKYADLVVTLDQL